MLKSRCVKEKERGTDASKSQDKVGEGTKDPPHSLRSWSTY